MASTGEIYVVPFKNDEAKKKFRQWMGKNRGVSIMHTEWMFTDDGWSHAGCDGYKIKITNPKTVLLLLLTFPEAMNEEQVAENKPDFGNSPILWTQ